MRNDFSSRLGCIIGAIRSGRRRPLQPPQHCLLPSPFSSDKMGAGQSKADTDEKVFYSDTPIQVALLRPYLPIQY
jgi:hypothetical protein